jgi:ubiquinone/menaquinone biosynthesis C-methylase UbiE
MGRQAQRRLHRGRAAVPLVRADVQAIPFPEMAFDHVLSTFPSEFITWPATLQNIHRVLRAEGRLVVIPLARFSGEGLPVRLLEWAYAITGQRPPALEETTNHPFWQALEGYGFKVSIEQVTLARSTVTVVIATKLL